MPSRNPERTVVELTDPRALRALAHPTRLKLVGLLRREGPLTATQLGDRIGESPSSCSFHLRQLAKWGLVEDAGGGKGRNRPWRATAELTSWKVDTGEQATAAGMFGTAIAQQYAELMLDWFRQMSDEPPAWRLAHHIGDRHLHLSPDELRELGQKVDALIASYDRDPRPDDRRVAFLYAGFPLPAPR